MKGWNLLLIFWGSRWYIAIVILIGVLVLDIFCHIDSYWVTRNESLVISFISVIATIVIIGNYAQVRDIESKSDRRIASMESEFALLRRSIEEDFRAYRMQSAQAYTISMTSQTNSAIKSNDWDSAASLWNMSLMNPVLSSFTEDFISSSVDRLKTIYNCDSSLKIDPERFASIKRSTHSSTIRGLQSLSSDSLEAAKILGDLLCLCAAP